MSMSGEVSRKSPVQKDSNCTDELFEKHLDDAMRQKFQTILDDLPIANKTLLLYILSLLSEISMYSKENRMDASNLSLVFAPIFMR